MIEFIVVGACLAVLEFVHWHKLREVRRERDQLSRVARIMAFENQLLRMAIGFQNKEQTSVDDENSDEDHGGFDA